MAIGSVLRFAQRLCGAASPIWLCSAVLLGLAVSDARADFIGHYAPGNFTLTNTGGGVAYVEGVPVPSANGDAVFPDLLTLVLTGTHDQSGVDGYTDLTITAPAAGVFRFNYLFQTDDDPGFQYAGYLLGSSGACSPGPPDCNFHLLANENGALNASGSVSVDVTAGELIGFRAGGDNQSDFAAVLTVTDFSAPVPEPATFQLLLIAGAAWGARAIYGRRRRAGSRR